MMSGTFDRRKITKEMLLGWIEAEKAVMTGQEYRMGTRLLRRADLRAIRDAIKYWEDELAKAEGRPNIRVRQIIPRDM